MRTFAFTMQCMLVPMIFGVALGFGFGFLNKIEDRVSGAVKDGVKFGQSMNLNKIKDAVEDGVKYGQNLNLNQVENTAKEGVKFGQNLNQDKLKSLLKNGVQTMEIEANDVLSPVNEPYGKQVKGEGGKLLGKFSWQPCSKKDMKIDIHSLSLKPEPLYFPGTLQIGFDVEFVQTIPSTSDLTGQLNLDVKSGGSSWIHVPCLGNIGSCTYKDLCSMTKMIQTCPDPFITAGIPCKCPFPKGEYKLSNLRVEIDASVFLPGDYRANVTLNNSQGELGCYQMTFTIG